MEKFRFNHLTDLKRGDAVVVTKEDKKPIMTTIKSIGKKYITVDDVYGIVFYNKQPRLPFESFIEGGCKDGSFTVYKLWKVPTIEDYENLMKELEHKKNVNKFIVKILESRRNNIEDSDYEEIEKILNKYE